MSIPLTLSNLDDEIFRRLELEAKRRSVDIETVAKELLIERLQTQCTPAVGNGKFRDASSLAGTWNESEYQEFMSATADFGRIEPEAWQ
ncbi:MAG TPA: hypothetical protein VGI75_05185 [Pirellulales bacterium]|jgi:plasmid stability protein